MWFTLENTQGCENFPSLPVPEAESSAGKCSDGEPSAPSKSRSTREASSYNAKKTESSTSSRYGMMSAPSTADRGAEMSISSVEVSPVRTSASQDEDLESSEESGADCGESTPVSFARYDRATASWRTAQCLLLGGLESFSGTWPRSGMMRRGRCYPLKIAAHRMNGRGCGSSQKIPTPTVHGNYNRKGLSKNSADGLATYVKKWPTPQSRDFKSGMASRVERSWRNLNDWAAKFPTPCRMDYNGAGKTGTFRDRLTPRTNGMCGGSGAWAQMGRLVREGKMMDKERHQIGAGNGGKLNPDWVEWLMGWPIGWTASKPLATDRFQSWQQGRFAN